MRNYLKRTSWAEVIEVITKVVTAGSIIGAGLWTLVTFVETRRTEVETRNREITKPFREAQLKMCDELTIQAARFVRTVDDPVPHTLDIQFFHNEAEQMRGTAARAEFLGDRRLALLAMNIGSVGFNCGWDRALAAREPERGKKFEEEPHRGRKFCQACLTYLQFLIAERCFDLMRSWWVEPQVERLDGGESVLVPLSSDSRTYERGGKMVDVVKDCDWLTKYYERPRP